MLHISSNFGFCKITVRSAYGRQCNTHYISKFLTEHKNVYQHLSKRKTNKIRKLKYLGIASMEPEYFESNI